MRCELCLRCLCQARELLTELFLFGLAVKLALEHFQTLILLC